MLHARITQPFKNLIAPAIELPMRRKLPHFTKPFVNIEFKRGSYTVKTVASHSEFLEVLRLRFDVFHKEYMKKKWKPFGFDIEAYDQFADHLAVRDDETGRIIGCYRIISSAWSSCFYSETEFDLTEFLDRPGEKLELSRACIHRRYRTGIVLNLLWRGVMEYIVRTGAQQLFGIPSITITDPAKAASICAYLKSKGHLGTDLAVRPLAAFAMPGFDEELRRIGALSEKGIEDIELLTPPLMRTYIKAGAKIYGAPALDRKFQCIDFFTVLNTEDLNSRYGKRYQQ